jgi:hypothetical protein
MNQFFYEIIKGNEKQKVSDTSLKIYAYNLAKIYDSDKYDDDDIIRYFEDIDNINNKLIKYKPSTKKVYLSSILFLLKSFDDNKYITSIIKKYVELLNKISDDIDKNQTDEKTETQKKNWIEWDEVTKKHEELYKYVKSLIGRKIITRQQYKKVLQFICLSLYVLFPVRRNIDYITMQIKNIVLLTDDTDMNYIDYTHKRFIFNTYKTAKFIGQTIEDIPDKLYECINLYIKLHPILKGNTENMNTRFLVAFNGRPLTISNDMTRILNDIFNKNIGVTMLRHIFITHRFGNLKKEREDIANKMGHSTDMQDIYIKK